jgi:hypothetical protein
MRGPVSMWIDWETYQKIVTGGIAYSCPRFGVNLSS